MQLTMVDRKSSDRLEYVDNWLQGEVVEKQHSVVSEELVEGTISWLVLGKGELKEDKLDWAVNKLSLRTAVNNSFEKSSEKTVKWTSDRIFQEKTCQNLWK